MNRMLDIGCGKFKYHPLAIGIDRRLDSNRDIVADAQYLPFRSTFFDKVTMQAVLEHLDSPLLVLKEVYRVLKNTGELDLIIPNRLHFMTYFAWVKQAAIYVDPEHIYAWTVPELRNLLERGGFNLDFVDFIDKARWNPLSRFANWLPRITKQNLHAIATKKGELHEA